MNAAPYVILYLVPAAISAGLALYGWRRRHARAAMLFSLLMAAVVFWSVCHALSAASTTLPAVLLWAQIQYGGIALVAPLWLLFALAYSDSWPQITPAQRAALLAPAPLIWLAVLTNGWHHLWWPTVGLDTSRPFGSLSITRGVLFWIHFVYSYGCALLGFALFVRSMLVAAAPFRRQAQWVAAGAFVPLIGNLAHILGLRTAAVDDPTPFLFAACGLAMFYAALRYQFLDLTPIAQREIFAGMPDGVVVLDQRGVVTAINDLAPPLLAAKATKLIGRPLLESIAGSPLEIDLRALLATPDIPATYTIAYETSGGLRGVEIRLRPLLADGALAGALLVLRDHSDRAQMEWSLEQRLGELTAINRLARAANAALQTDDMVRAITRELMRVLPGDRVVIGLLGDDGATLRLVIDETPGSAPTLEGQAVSGNDFVLLQNMLRAGGSQVISIADRELEGTATQAILRREGLRTLLVVPLYSQAIPLGAMFVGHTGAHTIAPDEIRLFETVGELITEAIVRTQLYDQAQEASRAKSTFLATVSHELRTPLTSILGFAEMLQHGLFGPLPERTHEPLDHIRRSSLTLMRLINDILDFSKIEAGRFTIERYPVDLPSVVEAVAGAMQPQVKMRGLELKLEVPRGAPLVYANSERLEQVLTNLVANAIKFTDHGSITIQARYDDDQVRLSVVDTGIGIALEQQRELFQEFQQLDNQHTRRGRGTGLGLAISRRLIELMGGSLTIESAPGVGSTFHCHLPIIAETLREKQAASDSV
jgi:signal transduction histidine kinase/PAS domain-containing protein